MGTASMQMAAVQQCSSRVQNWQSRFYET